MRHLDEGAVVAELIGCGQAESGGARETVDVVGFAAVDALLRAHVLPASHQRQRDVGAAYVEPALVLDVDERPAPDPAGEGRAVGPAGLFAAGVEVAQHLGSIRVQRAHRRRGRGEQVDVEHLRRDANLDGAGELPLPGDVPVRLPPAQGRAHRCGGVCG